MRNKVAKPLRKIVTQRCRGSIKKHTKRNPLRHMKRIWNQTPWNRRHEVMLKMLEEI